MKENAIKNTFGIEVGDIFAERYGDEPRYTAFYQIVEIPSPHFVDVRRIGCESLGIDRLPVPIPDFFLDDEDEPFSDGGIQHRKVRISDEEQPFITVKIDCKTGHAFLFDGEVSR